nr:hypothetical protein [Tanacetum cinerariifolium]
MFYVCGVQVKEYQEKDKIGSKPDKNGKRGEAGKSQKQLQWIKQEKLKKTQKEGPEMQRFIYVLENFSGMSIKIRKKEKLLQQKQWAYLSTHPSKRLTSLCYDDDDDEDYTSVITLDEPVLSTEEPNNSLSMGDEHLDTIPATESDEFIKSGVENLILILNQFEDFSESTEEFSSIDDDSFSLENINYVEASPPDSELVSSEVMEIVTRKGSRETLLLKAFLNDDHSFDFKTKSSSTSLNSLLEETNNFNNSLPEFTTFSKVLFDAKYESDSSDSSDDQSCSDEEVLEKIFSKPMCEEEIIPMKSLRTHDSSLPISSKIDFLLDEFAGELTLLKSILPGIDETYCDLRKTFTDLEPIGCFVTHRDMARDGLTPNSKVYDIIINGTWLWPHDLITKFSVLNNYNVPTNEDDVDRLVNWYSMVWFPFYIPRHVINLWLIVRRKLKTQDLIPTWDVSSSLGVVCSLCESNPNSHDHLFFECPVSCGIWNRVKGLARLNASNPNIYDIIQDLLPIVKHYTTVSVIAKLVMAASAYYVWQERNWRVNTLELKKLMNFFRSRKFSVIWSFDLLRVCKSTKISFISEDGLAIEWNSKNLTEFLKRESDEFILNHEGDKNDSGVISLKGNLTIKVQNEMRDNWLINFVETIKTNVRKATIDMIRDVVKLINNSTLMNTSIFDGFVKVSNRRRYTGCLGYFGNVGTVLVYVRKLCRIDTFDPSTFDLGIFFGFDFDHWARKCQPMNQDSYHSNSLGFDQPQLPQSPVIHQPPQELSIPEMEDLMQQYLDELKRLSNLEYHDENMIAELTENFNGMSIKIRKKENLDYTSAITPDEPVLSTEEPDNSLSIGDEHLDTIPATESDEFIKSGVENLIPIPSESEEFSSIDDDSFSFDNIDYVEASPPDSELVSSEVDAFLAVEDEPTSSQFPKSYLDLEGDMLLFKAFLNDDHSSDFKTKSSSTSLNSLLEETNNFNNSLPEFTTFSKVLFDAEYESDSSDDQSCSDEDVLEKTVSKPLCEEEIIPMKSLQFVSANSDAKIKSFSPSLILVKDSDSLMEEIDLFCTLDYPMPPGIEDKDYDSERDLLISKDLPSNNSLSFAEK